MPTTAQPSPFTAIQSCDIKIAAIERVEAQIMGSPLEPLFEEFWHRWVIINGPSLKRTRGRSQPRHHIHQDKARVLLAVEQVTTRRNSGALVPLNKAARKRHLARLNRALSIQLSQLPNLLEYVERPVSVTNRSILMALDQNPKLEGPAHPL